MAAPKPPTVPYGNPSMPIPWGYQGTKTQKGKAVPVPGGGPAGTLAVYGGGQNLVFNTSTLTDASRVLGGLADDLSGPLTNAQTAGDQAVTSVHSLGGGRPWPQVSALNPQVANAHQLVSGFVTDLKAAHTQTSNSLKSAANTYNAAELDNVASSAHISSSIKAQISGDIAKQSKNLLGLQGNWSPTNSSITLVQQGGLTMSAPQALAVDRIMDHTEPDGAAQNESWPVLKWVTSDNPFPVPVTDGTSNLTPADVQTMMANAGTASNDLHSAGLAYETLTEQLGNAATALAETGYKIAGTFSGKAAVQMVNQIQQLYQTAAGLQTNSYQLSQALHYYGSTLQTFQGGPQVAANTNVNDAQAAAKEYMTNLNTGISNVWGLLPPSVGQNLPSPQSGSGGGGRSSVPPGGSSVPPGGSSVPPGGTTPISVASAPTTPPPTSTPPTSTPPLTTPPVTPSPAIPPLSVPSVGPDFSTTDNGLTDGGLGDNALGPDEIPSISGLGTNGLGTGSLITGSNTGAAADDSLAAAGDSTGAQTDGMVGFPGVGGMGGTSGGDLSTGRTRQSWMSEDDGIWDPEGDGAFTSGLPGIGGDGMIGGALGPELSASTGTFGGADSAVGGSDTGPGGGLVGGGGLDGASGPAASADSAAGADAGMFPFMGGSGAGGQDRDGRQRQAWMNEDADLWAPGEHSVPPVLG